MQIIYLLYDKWEEGYVAFIYHFKGLLIQKFGRHQ